MKRFTSILLLAALAFSFTAWSCEQDPEPEQNNEEQQKPEENNNGQNGNTETPTGPQPGTYKFVASPLKGTWKAGDQIYVHGNLGTEAKVYTLSAGDISSDGKTATAKLDEVVTNSPYDPDGLYAAWPGESVYLFKGVLKSKTTYLECDGLLTQACLKDDTFSFIDVSSLISFTVSGDYNNWAICSNDRDGICITKFEVEYSSDKKVFNYKQNDGYPFRYGNIESGATKIWFPGDFTFPEGYTLYLGRNDSWTASYSVGEAVTLTSGQTLDLGDITSKIEAYNGLPPRMPRQGAETKYKVQFNELSGICLSADGDFIWGVGDDGELAKISFEGAIIESHYVSGDTEAISRNPETGDLLIGLEPDGVGVIKAPGFTGNVKSLFKIAKAKNYGNAGIEGLTYYKDGMIYVGTQTDSRLFCVELATGNVLWDKAMYNKKLVSEIADLCYDPLTDWLWIMDSENKKVFVYTGDSETLLGAYPVSGSNPESVFVDHIHSCIWVGDDYGEPSYLYRYDFTGLDDFNL